MYSFAEHKQCCKEKEEDLFVTVHQNFAVMPLEIFQERNLVDSAVVAFIEKLKELLHRWEHVIVMRENELKQIDNFEEINHEHSTG